MLRRAGPYDEDCPSGVSPNPYEEYESSVKSTVENLSETRVKLTVEIPFEDLNDSIEQAYKRIAGQRPRVPARQGPDPHHRSALRPRRGPRGGRERRGAQGL